MEKPSRRDIPIVAVAWLFLTIAGEWWAAQGRLYPTGASTDAEIIDGAFDLLLYLGIPVFTFVLVMLVYSVLRFRSDGDSDGPAIRNDRRFAWPWLVVSAGLTVFVTINPGLIGLSELAAEDVDADMTVNVTAQQWNWTFDYADYGVTLEKADELVLPEGERILLRVTSLDVIHSLWIPAFRIKADAVPGRVHDVYLTPTEEGGFDTDSTFRVQCAEMCGTGHARMRADVRVVDEAEFDAWIQDQAGNE
jgi:cytochrome c oxidase subunit 2